MYKGILMDSNLERECAMILDSKGWKWEYHKIINIWHNNDFSLGIEHEMDFIVINGFLNILIEAKGKVLQDYRIKRKLIIDYCRTYGYEFFEYTRKYGLKQIIKEGL